jgi:hypothetical protein
MPSSITNSEPLAWQRVVTVGATLLGVLAMCCALLMALFHKPEYQALAVADLTPDKELLAVGSSRVLFGFDPRLYAVPAASLPANYLDLERARAVVELHLAKLPALKVALIEFDTATLRYDTDVFNPNGLFDLGFSRVPPLSEWATHFDRALHKALSPIFAWRLTPAFYRIETRATSGLEPMAAVPGHVPSALVVPLPAAQAATGVTSTREELRAMGPGVYPRNLAAAEALVSVLVARGVKPVLLRFPEEPSLRAIYPKDWTELVTQSYRELAKSLPGPAPAFWDLSEDPAFLSEHFRDPDHLNQAGAEVLATTLAPRLAALLK